MKRTVLVGWILLLFHVRCFSLPVQASDAQDTQKSCANFVQSFYDWYITHPDSSRALKERPSAFSPELSRRLKEDHEAQAKAPGDIAGLDFDPFLNSQDPGDPYSVGRIKINDENTCWAEVHIGSANKMSRDAIVAAELANNAGRWQFVNFHYSSANSDFSASVSSGGLLGLLKDLREARRKDAKAQSSATPTPQPNSRVPASKPHP
jgi:hypothetical protein